MCKSLIQPKALIQMFVCCYRIEIEVRVWQECCLPFEKSFYVGSVSFVYSEIWLLLYKNYIFIWYRQNHYSCISQIIYSRLDITLRARLFALLTKQGMSYS